MSGWLRLVWLLVVGLLVGWGVVVVPVAAVGVGGVGVGVSPWVGSSGSVSLGVGRGVWLGGPTYVSSSSLSVDTTWGPAGSPYVVSSSVVVPAGVTLTILPGTVVKFTSDRDGGAPINLDGLVVLGGRLVARGTIAAPIVLTSVHDDSAGGDTDPVAGRAPARGDWMGVQVDPSAAAGAAAGVSVLEHVSVRFAGEGGSTGCQAGAAVKVGQYGRLRLLRSEVVDSRTSGVSLGDFRAGNDVGSGEVAQVRFARSNCGVFGSGGSVTASIIESSVPFGFKMTPNGVSLSLNWVWSPTQAYSFPRTLEGTGRTKLDAWSNAFMTRGDGVTPSCRNWDPSHPRPLQPVHARHRG